MTRENRPHYRAGVCILLLSGFLLVFGARVQTARAAAQEIQISGQTMGTMYQIIVVRGGGDPDNLDDAISGRLQQVNRQMSTFIPTSEISRFNALTQTGRPFTISENFRQVMDLARQLYQLTDGAWDGTIAPLVNLWGFGAAGPTDQVPTHKKIRALLPHVGFNLIDVGPGARLAKKDPAVTLDLASVAKGYGVDQVAALLTRRGFHHYLVEIGGEVYAAGHRPDGRPWRVGINRPERNAPFDAVYKVVALSNRALATSGDYRNYFETGGRYYGHIIDPRTGMPVASGVVSVSVIADTCALADGLATGIMVMDVDKGLALIDRLACVACLIVVRTPDGRFVDHPSRTFPFEKR